MTKLDLTLPPTRLQQRIIDDENGDCCRTAIAMVLGLASPEDVPNSRTWEEKEDWLRARGVGLVHIPLPCKTPECLAEHLPYYLRGCPAVLSGLTVDDCHHSIAIIDDEPVDTVPWIENHCLVKPCKDGWYWITLMVPLRSSVSVSVQ